MEPRMRASPKQFGVLIEFMERYGDVSRPQAGPQGRIKSDRLWSELCTLLNSVGGGVQRSTDKWKKRPPESHLDEDGTIHLSQNISDDPPLTLAPVTATPPPTEETQPSLHTVSLPQTPPAQQQPSSRVASVTPQFLPTTQRRALLRARRNRELTPFDRAASEFVAVEQGSLKFEEIRDRRPP